MPEDCSGCCNSSRDTILVSGKLPIRLVVGHQTLDLGAQVRILHRQPVSDRDKFTSVLHSLVVNTGILDPMTEPQANTRW